MPQVTVAIPTFNRCKLIGESIESVLSQTYGDFELLIIDNASTDSTKRIVSNFKDDRIRYHRNGENIGIINNWNRCISISRGKYLIILGDDDRIHPDFLEKSVSIHQKHKQLGFSFSHCNKVDPNGKFLMRWGYDFVTGGLIKGMDYLYYTVKYGCCLTNSSTVLINKHVFNKVGMFKAPYGANTFDFNMWVKIAEKCPVFFIDKVMCDYRLHPDQISEIHWRRPEMPTGKIGTYLELFNIIGLLLKNKNQINSRQKSLVLKRMNDFDNELSTLLKKVITEL